MLRLLPIFVMLVLLVTAFWWLPFGFAIAFAVLILFLVFLEVFLADIRGRHLTAFSASAVTRCPPG